MKKYLNSVVAKFDTTQNGNAAAGTTITVRDSSNGLKVTLYSDNGVTQKDNPFMVDSNANYEFYVADGRYDIYQDENLATELVLRDVSIFDVEQLISENEATIDGLTSSSRNYPVNTSLILTGFSFSGDGNKSQWLKTADTGTPSQDPVETGDGTLTDATGAVWRIVGGVANFDITYSIPTDYADLQSAIDDTYDKISTASGNSIIINIESGHFLTKGLTLSDGDYSHYRITSDDATVSTDPLFVPVDSSPVPESSNAAFYYQNCKTPIHDFLLDGNGTGSYDGLIAYANASVYLEAGAGVTGCRANLEVRAGEFFGKGTMWSNAHRGCCRFTESTRFTVSESTMNESWQNPPGGQSVSSAALHISRSSIGQAQGCTITDSGLSGVSVRRSRVYLDNTVITNVQTLGLGNSNIAIRPLAGATVVLGDVTFNGSLIDEQGCDVEAFNSTGPHGIVYNGAAPNVIGSYNNTDSNNRVINIYDSVRIAQYRLTSFSLNDPDVTVSLGGLSGDGFYSGYVTLSDTGDLGNAGYAARAQAFNSLAVAVQADEARIRMTDPALAVAETVDIVLTVVGHPS